MPMVKITILTIGFLLLAAFVSESNQTMLPMASHEKSVTPVFCRLSHAALVWRPYLGPHHSVR
jgi:hypothetical protein